MGLDWDQLIAERDAWVAHNFPTTEETAPMETVMGVFEEVGELTHAHLKQRQAIRGDDAKHEADAQDAVGDATVYLLGVLSFTNHRPQTPRTGIHDPEGAPTDYFLLKAGGSAGRLYTTVSNLLSARTREGRGKESWRYGMLNSASDRIVYYLQQYCLIRGWDYDEIVQRTWDGVKQRDWILYPDTGLPPTLSDPGFDPSIVGSGGVCPRCAHAGGNPTSSGCDICDD